MSAPSPEEILLAVFGNLAVGGWVDRRAAEVGGVDHATGIPLSGHDMAPRAYGVSGHSLALEYQIVPRSLAAGSAWREQVNPDGTRERVALASVPEAQWTQLEREFVNHLSRQFKLAAHRLTEKAGWFDLQPELDPEGNGRRVRLALGGDGLTMGFKITPRGLKAAIELVKRRPELRQLPQLEQAYGAEAWRGAPDHYKQRASLPVSI